MGLMCLNLIKGGDMSQEMKLLMELCKSLGFKVETIIDYDERKETESRAMEYNKGIGYPEKDRTLKCDNGPYQRLHIDDDGMYTSILRNPEISYKLTNIK